MIYLDASATSLRKPPTVAKAVYEAIQSERYGNPGRGASPASILGLEALYESRESLTRLFHLPDPLQLVLTSNATHSLNLAMQGLLPEGHVITSLGEHNSVLRPLYQYRSRGGSLSFLPLDEDGRIETEKVEDYLREDTRAIVLTQASNVTGLATDLAPVVDLCRRKKLLLILDGSQGAGTLDTDLSALEDFPYAYAFTGHKSLYGPQGTGGLILGKLTKPRQVFTGGSGHHSFLEDQPQMIPDIYEPGTGNVPGALGLKAGADYLLQVGMQAVESDLQAKRAHFLQGLKAIPGLHPIGLSPGPTCPIVSMRFDRMSSAKAGALLYKHFGIVGRSGIHCAPLLHKSLGTDKEGLLRLSFSTFTTYDDLDTSLEALEKLTKL